VTDGLTDCNCGVLLTSIMSVLPVSPQTHEHDGHMRVVTFFEGDDTSFTATYLVVDTQAKKCAILDPSYNFNQSTGVITTSSADK